MSTQRKQKSAVGEQAKTSQVKVNNQFPIVGIGASAGGLDPIRKLLDNLPTDTGMAFVVIQHLATGQESMLPEILSRATQMSVLQVKDGMKVEKNQVYVITPGTTMTLKNGFLRLVPKGVALKPINDFFISLASERKALSIGVVLSGTGNDGTEGLKAIKAEGGITFVQDPETAQYNDMPRNAIDAETAYFVLSPENIVKEIVRIIKNPQLTRAETVVPELSKTETPLKKIISMLKTAFGVDFTHYKETTINRRLTRRMVINKIENDKDYVAFLRANPNELNALFDDLLIGVTSFFREPKTFEALKEKVFPELIKNRSTNENIRVWVPGCSTGEEVYSLAIVIQEFLEEKALANLRVQIFGTDANEKNIEKARLGLYPKAIEDNVLESRLKRFFKRQNGNYQITKFIREMCIFAKQDITSDPPFSNLDFIMCRNVLIYFDSLLHERVFPIFHYGLKDNGFLIIGESESIGKFSYLFEPVTTKGLIFRKKRAQPQGPLHLEAFASYSPAKKNSKQVEKPNFLDLLKEEVDSLLIAEYAPASLLVNNNLEILVFRGQVNPYLTHEPGTASLNVAKMVQKELRTEVQTAIYRARKENKAFKETVQFKHDGQQKTLTIKVNPLKTVDYEEPFFLITFQEESSHRKLSQKETESNASFTEKESDEYNHVQDLKEDLESTKQSLQTIIEVQEATNEELRSTMEEAQSSNEELQSTNEELETAKEELQSSNEELHTLNEELKNRNQTLGRLNDDLANLQTNTAISVVIVDGELKIRRLTVSAQELLDILPSDVGRPITSINLGVHFEDLEKTITNVIDKPTAIDREVPYAKDRLLEMSIRPYLSGEKKIDGAVLSFTDITERKKNEKILEEYRDSLEKLVEERNKKLELASLYARSLIEASLDPLVTISNDGKIIDVNKATEDVTGYSHEELVGSDFSMYFTEPEEVRKGYKKVFDEGFVRDYSLAMKHKTGRITRVVYNALIYRNPQGEVQGVFAAARDTTELKKAQEEARENAKKLKDAERLAAIGTTAGMVGHDIRNPLQAITGDVFLMKSDLSAIAEGPEKVSMNESLEEIEKNIGYINKIVADLQDYAKPINPVAKETDIEALCQEILSKNGLPRNIQASCQADSNAKTMIADPDLLKRVLSNLITNAGQAMQQGGKLDIHTFKDANDTVITVQDTGVGIPLEVRDKLFTPLFTTKSKGQGFGLAVVKRMTEALGGSVSFESEIGKGTKFILRFPPPKS